MVPARQLYLVPAPENLKSTKNKDEQESTFRLHLAPEEPENGPLAGYPRDIRWMVTAYGKDG